MKKVTIYEAKTHLSRLIQQAIKGESIIIAKGKKPLVELRVIGNSESERTLGDYKGRIKVSADFNALLPDFNDFQ